MPAPSTAPIVPPPDGGWGWAVVLGSFISIGFSYAFPKAITVFFKDIQIIFNASYSQVAWISSIMLAVMYAAGTSPLKLEASKADNRNATSCQNHVSLFGLLLWIMRATCCKETDWRSTIQFANLSLSQFLYTCHNTKLLLAI